MQGRHRVTVEDVAEVHRNGLLGPSGQSDLVHYETRLRDAFDDEALPSPWSVAEAVVEGVWPRRAKQRLWRRSTES